MYATPQPKEKTSWRSWGDVLSDEAANNEVSRIQGELKTLSSKAEFKNEFLPIVKVKSPEEATEAVKGDIDVILLYAASGSSKIMQACADSKKDMIIFVREKSGATYYWYEALSTVLLATDKDPSERTAPPLLGKVHVDDVVVDDIDEILWRVACFVWS